MGSVNAFVGRIDVVPALNPDEIDCLAELGRADVVEQVAGRRIGSRRPGSASPWQPCSSGCCLRLEGDVDCQLSVKWLRYLIRQFLAPAAAASRSGLSTYRRFTFDHSLDGLVAGVRGRSGELHLISVVGNRVTTKALRGGNTGRLCGELPSPEMQGGPAVEAQSGAVVVDLASRRVRG